MARQSAKRSAKKKPARRVNGLPPATPIADNWVKGKPTAREIAQPRVPVDRIVIGKRFRKQYGDIPALTADINERGILQPPVVDRQDNLIAGERRIKAWKLSKFRDEPIPVHVVPLEDLVAGEYAENDPTLRKDFTWSEAVAIKQAIEAKLRPIALLRQKAGVPADPSEKGRAGARAAAYTGKKIRTLEKAQAIVAAAEAEPETYGALVEAMDKSGRVDGPFKRMKNIRAAAAIRKEAAPLPDQGPYRAGMIDFPWPSETDGNPEKTARRGYYPYPTMTIPQIVEFCKTKVRPILHKDAVIGVWITNFHLLEGHHLAVIAALGGKAPTMLTGRKDTIGQGQIARGSTEHLMIVRVGKPTILTFPRTDFDWKVDRKRHSHKPQIAFDLFERAVAASRYFSLFDTVDRGPKWDCHGDKMKTQAAPVNRPIKCSVFGAGDRVGPKALAVMLRKWQAGCIPNARGSGSALLQLANGSFVFGPRPNYGDHIKLIAGLEFSQSASGLEVGTYVDAGFCGFCGSTMPYRKVEKVLIAWGKTPDVAIAAAEQSKNSKKEKAS